MKYKKVSLVLVGAIVSTVFLGGCSQAPITEAGCTPPASETSTAKTFSLATAVQDLECMSLEEFAILNCAVLDNLPSEVIEPALSSAETLKKATKPKEALALIKQGLPNIETLADWKPFEEAQKAVLRDLNKKAQAQGYAESGWHGTFERALIKHCEEGKEFSQIVSALESFEDERGRVRELASLAWAPEGFLVDEETGIAYKKLDGRGCNWGYCLNYEMVAQTYCAVLKATLWIDSPLVYDSEGQKNVDKGELVRVQLNTEYDLTKVGHEVRFSCLGS